MAVEVRADALSLPFSLDTPFRMSFIADFFGVVECPLSGNNPYQHTVFEK